MCRIAERLHVLRDDVRVPREVHHDINDELVNPHVPGDVGTVAVTLHGVRVAWSLLTCDMMGELWTRAVFGSLTDTLQEQGILFEGFVATERADVDF